MNRLKQIVYHFISIIITCFNCKDLRFYIKGILRALFIWQKQGEKNESTH